MSEISAIKEELSKQDKELHAIKHELAQFPPQMAGLYKNQEFMEKQLEQIQVTLDEMNKTISTIITKIDGDSELGYSGLRKQVEYLMNRDKWLKNKWVLATGGIGGLALIYGLARAGDFIIELIHKMKQP